MTTKYTSNLRKGDVVIHEEGILQTVKEVHPAGGKNVSIVFENNTTLIVNMNTKIPVLRSHVNTKLSIAEVYTMILDDNISLSEFTLWCNNNQLGTIA
jgi:preprotein translocase subunit YajC